MNKENQLFLRLCDVLTDVVLVVLAMLISYFLRFWILQGTESMPLMFYVRSALLISLLYLLLFSTLGLYETKQNVLILQVVQQILLVSLACSAVLATIYFTSRTIDVSRGLLFFFFLVSTALLSGKRVISMRLRRLAYSRGMNVRPVLLVGSGRSAAEYYRTLQETPWLGYQLLGTVGAKPLANDVPYLGPLDVLDDVLRDTSAEELVAALDSDEFSAMDRIVNLTEKYGLKFSLVPYFAPYMTSKPYIDQFGSLPLVNLRRIPLDNFLNALIKRMTDILGSLFLILLTSPLMLFAALGTLITLGRPIIFKQTRVGYQRREFTMWKFRSMREAAPDDQSGWSSYDRDRLTRFGAFLRKTSIDELPQLFNVLRGSMSLVGPRPELPKYVDQFRETVPLYMLKHQVRPGITGLAQVSGYRGDTSIEARIRLDLRYIETWSFLLDVKILFLTLFHFMNNGETSNMQDSKQKAADMTNAANENTNSTQKTQAQLRAEQPEEAKGTQASPATRGGGARRGFPTEIPLLILGFALAYLTLLQFMENQKWLILTCCILSAVLTGFALFGQKKRKVPTVFCLLYGVHLLWLSLGLLWVCSGKLFLREFSKQLYVLPLIIFVLFLMPRKETAIRRLLFLMSAMGAVYAFFSIDIATVGLTRGLLYLIPTMENAHTGFEEGTRLFGIFGNANISAGLLAICIFLSLYLLESAENRRERIFAVVFAALQAQTFLLNFSLGATGIFLVCVLVYLIFAGQNRGSVLIRMLELALPVICSVFVSFRFFEVSGSPLPLIAAILSAVVAVVLELTVYPRLGKTMKRRNQLSTVLIAAVLIVFFIYGAAGLLVRGSAKLEEEQSLRRSCYPAAGEYTLSVQAEGNVRVRIISQDDQQVVMHTQSTLYAGAADGAEFEVPEGARVVYITFSAPQGAVLTDAVLTGEETIPIRLDYPLLPGFIANRLQGLWANENAIQRAAFFRDGLKVFRDHPIFGTGLGGFETLLFGYQEFYYETKYVHNHYIQTMLDSGIIGLLIYLSMLAATAAALWRGRRKDAPYRNLHPALTASFVMIVLHSLMEVVMSITVYLPFALVIMSVAAICFGSPLKKAASRLVSSVLPCIIALVYAVLIILNLNANSAVKKSTDHLARFFSALEYASKVDAFEKNDWMVSYISNCAEYEMDAYRPKSEEYAEKLMNVPSNSLHQHLIIYYLVFEDFDNALLAARKSAEFNYSDSGNWNKNFSYFTAALATYPQEYPKILECVRILEQDLQEYQKKLMRPISLSEESQALIEIAYGTED